MEQVVSPVSNTEAEKLANVEVAEVPPEERAVFLGCLADEFIDPANRSTFVSRAQACLLNPPQQVVEFPDKFPRGACLIGMKDLSRNGQPVGATFLKIYSAELIAPQLYMDIDFNNDLIRLMRFREMQVKAHIPPDIPAVVELEYNWVDEDSRKKGYGKGLAKAGDAIIKSAFGISPVASFGMIRTTPETTEHGHRLFQYLLEQEASVHGIDEKQRPNVLGTSIRLSSTLNALDIPHQVVVDGVDARAQASQYIFKRLGLSHVGWNRGLSHVYAGFSS